MSRAAKRTDRDPGRGRIVLFGPSKSGPPTLSPPCVWRRRKRGARSRVLAGRYKLPAMYCYSNVVDIGGLMANAAYRAATEKRSAQALVCMAIN